MLHCQSVLLAALCSCTLASPVVKHELDSLSKRATPYARMVAFGDDYTDNGQGSYAHGITGNTTTGKGKHLWGADTWTDGPIAATHLAQALGIPLTYDYAFGSSGGGQTVGSVCNTTRMPANNRDSHAKLLDGSIVPDAISQVANYTGPNGKKFRDDIENTLHFFWTGNDDMIASLGYVGRFTICSKDTKCYAGQKKFITNLIDCQTRTLTALIEAGAKHILVPSVHPKQNSPWMSQYVSADPGMIANFASVINQHNSLLKSATEQLSSAYGVNVMYFDAYAFLVKHQMNIKLIPGTKYNYSCADGCTTRVDPNMTNWQIFRQTKVVEKKPNPFFWMTTNMPSSGVHKALALQMKSFLGMQSACYRNVTSDSGNRKRSESSC